MDAATEERMAAARKVFEQQMKMMPGLQGSLPAGFEEMFGQKGAASGTTNSAPSSQKATASTKPAIAKKAAAKKAVAKKAAVINASAPPEPAASTPAAALAAAPTTSPAIAPAPGPKSVKAALAAAKAASTPLPPPGARSEPSSNSLLHATPSVGMGVSSRLDSTDEEVPAIPDLDDLLARLDREDAEEIPVDVPSVSEVLAILDKDAEEEAELENAAESRRNFFSIGRISGTAAARNESERLQGHLVSQIGRFNYQDIEKFGMKMLSERSDHESLLDRKAGITTPQYTSSSDKDALQG